MPNSRLPITVKRIPGGAVVQLADGRRLYVYGREPDVAQAARTMTRDEAETLAKDVARALTAQWSGDVKAREPQRYDRREPPRYDHEPELFDLAERKGYSITKSTHLQDHVRLIDNDGNLVRNQNGGAAHSYSEARRYLESLPDRSLRGASSQEA